MYSTTRIDEILAKLEEAHLRLLWVCLDCPKDDQGTFCGEWIKNRCDQERIAFHQGWLRKLANLDVLQRRDSSRRGGRRYYSIKDDAGVRQLLALQPA